MLHRQDSHLPVGSFTFGEMQHFYTRSAYIVKMCACAYKQQVKSPFYKRKCWFGLRITDVVTFSFLLIITRLMCEFLFHPIKRNLCCKIVSWLNFIFVFSTLMSGHWMLAPTITRIKLIQQPTHRIKYWENYTILGLVWRPDIESLAWLSAGGSQRKKRS